MCENGLEEIQGAAFCSFIPPPLLQDSWSCVQLMFPECNGSGKRDFALHKAKSIAFKAQGQSNDQTYLQCKARRNATVRSNKLLAQLEIDDLDVIEGKGFTGLDTLNNSVVQL